MSAENSLISLNRSDPLKHQAYLEILSKVYNLHDEFKTKFAVGLESEASGMTIFVEKNSLSPIISLKLLEIFNQMGIGSKEDGLNVDLMEVDDSEINIFERSDKESLLFDFTAYRQAREEEKKVLRYNSFMKKELKITESEAQAAYNLKNPQEAKIEFKKLPQIEINYQALKYKDR